MGAQQMASRIELWPVDKLTPYANNARQHPQSQIEAIANSIKELGFNNPILVDADAGIVAGHGRLKAALKLGMTQVPVICLNHLTEAQRRAYVLIDNRTAELARWDEGLLAEEIAALEREYELALEGLGWTEEELSDIRAGLLDDLAVDPVDVVSEAPTSAEGGEGDEGREEVWQTKNLDELMNMYNSRTTRQLVLEYQNEDFELVVDHLGRVRDRWGVDNNSDAVRLLLEEVVGDA